VRFQTGAAAAAVGGNRGHQRQAPFVLVSVKPDGDVIGWDRWLHDADYVAQGQSKMGDYLVGPRWQFVAQGSSDRSEVVIGMPIWT
jgi:hypothetical protein